ncbi:hypothetical protein [Acutalibacter muris]|jgi:hypothetical protein|uniref:hypothetical protein n=1 Tax=Acutalibacter muris TaxID=1796620 RepID=UPI0025B75F02|nr:hypothetical protein [Acutalibacter muris]MCI9193717.1 hypothetical protein [Acutalibacter muris]
MKKCFMGDDGLDERQLLLRGNVYKHSLILMMALLLIDGFLRDEGIVWAQGMWGNILIFWAGMGLALVEFILRDILPRSRRQNSLYIFLGLCGLVLAVLIGTSIFIGHEPLIENGALNTRGAGLIQAAVMLGVCLLFIGKRVYDGRRRDEE